LSLGSLELLFTKTSEIPILFLNSFKINFFTNKKKGDVVSRLTSDIQQIEKNDTDKYIPLVQGTNKHITDYWVEKILKY